MEPYRSGEIPAINDRVRLIDVRGLWTQRNEMAELGEYDVDDLSRGMLLLVSETAAIWCVPGRCEKTTKEKPCVTTN